MLGIMIYRQSRSSRRRAGQHARSRSRALTAKRQQRKHDLYGHIAEHKFLHRRVEHDDRLRRQPWRSGITYHVSCISKRTSRQVGRLT